MARKGRDRKGGNTWYARQQKKSRMNASQSSPTAAETSRPLGLSPAGAVSPAENLVGLANLGRMANLAASPARGRANPASEGSQGQREPGERGQPGVARAQRGAPGADRERFLDREPRREPRAQCVGGLLMKRMGETRV